MKVNAAPSLKPQEQLLRLTELTRRPRSKLGGKRPPKKRSRKPPSPVPAATCPLRKMVSPGKSEDWGRGSSPWRAGATWL
ncbi:unnamed protein product [Gulo gulo]|uniref:Uncharacterized protein n=1 Tax=Gulo gulo TaxID=48420 RepID=A0A9X9LNN2_GULGU|nr:unnamed protein product [Gulo gulo]